MTLSAETKQKIIDIIDSEEFKTSMYEGLGEEKRKKLGQFYTPAAICIKMLEKYQTTEFSGQNILDPTCGSGNLLIAMLIAGADLDRLYGNEYDADAVRLCRKRLLRAAEILGLDTSKFKKYQIHRGNALQTRCLTEFNTSYDCYYQTKYIDDLEYAQGVDKQGNHLSWAKERELAEARQRKQLEKSKKAVYKSLAK